jgi:hypothetical protein
MWAAISAFMFAAARAVIQGRRPANSPPSASGPVWTAQKVTLNMLWGQHAALEGGSWRDIDAETKARRTRAVGGKARK